MIGPLIRAGFIAVGAMLLVVPAVILSIYPLAARDKKTGPYVQEIIDGPPYQSVNPTEWPPPEDAFYCSETLIRGIKLSHYVHYSPVWARSSYISCAVGFVMLAIAAWRGTNWSKRRRHVRVHFAPGSKAAK